jgi:hypothetical protein
MMKDIKGIGGKKLKEPFRFQTEYYADGKVDSSLYLSFGSMKRARELCDAWAARAQADAFHPSVSTVIVPVE